MNISLVIRTKDEADRLRLTLASVARQSMAAEIVVVDDGSRDHTAAILAEAQTTMPLTILRQPASQGRCAASNAGLRAANGDVAIFLDGDTLAAPGLVAAHARAHAATAGLCGRGETFHLRQTRTLQDPEQASPRPGYEARLARMPPAEREALKVTRRQITEDFDGIHARATPGIYPGAGPRALYELEISALQNNPDCSVLWAASSGSNFSVRREAALAAGGFDEALENNEHRELALRLCKAGARMGFVPQARTYHLTHRTGWRDPLVERDWESIFYRRHPLPEVKLLAVLWASLADTSPIPPASRLRSLPELERAAADVSKQALLF